MTRTPLPCALLAIALLTSACGGGSTTRDAGALASAPIAKRIEVTSTAFANGQPIPRAYTCDGGGVIPPLRWHGVPNDAKTVAVVVDDPDAPHGPFVHWVVIELPPRTDRIAGRPSNGTELDNTAGGHGWTPPCPPPGRVHHYRFTVYALSDDVCAPNGDQVNQPGCAAPSTAQALPQIQQYALARGVLVGTYAR